MNSPFKLPLCSTLSSLTLLAILLTHPASAATYTAYPGSSVVVKAVSGQITGPSHTGVHTLGSTGSLSLPLLGGLAIPSAQAGYACVLGNQVFTLDNWRGVRVNSNGILVGLTGTILNGIAHYRAPGETTRTQVTGGLSFDAFGVATALGDVTNYYADRLCAAVPILAGSQVTTPGNAEWGNKFADLDLTMWIYVPVNISPGLYPLTAIGAVQGSSQGNSTTYVAYMPIIETGDTVEVLPPPCSISAQSNIVFDTTTEEGMKVNAPVTFQCGELSVPSALEAFLQVQPVGSTASDTELNLTINGSPLGGVVRGYAGQGMDSSQVNCLDNTHSLSFNQAFGLRLGTVTSNNNQETPLFWQLCRKGNEVPGQATGSAILIVNYK